MSQITNCRFLSYIKLIKFNIHIFPTVQWFYFSDHCWIKEIMHNQVQTEIEKIFGVSGTLQ